ncbi:AzlD domain-containing protein [Haloarcula sp. 1CSR25-25]|uniref:AzlD domain-containing protein n=1 Tax=Haloarcula sp. 1CSR25-25 TaxID=2862545 RepID=UPI002894C420|nr:AzlD domain-containing protein [Haloarcula sp. 1CSR25-25]MDT3436117.1 AzlD domain-containing protein [Haloarcula sp. 1CSR25-25]
MATSYDPAALVAAVALAGVLTYACRLSFIALFGRLEEIPPGVERPLRFVPAAVLAALVLPSFVTLDAANFATDKFVAGALAAGVAWKTENVFATMATGMGVLWAIRLLLSAGV